MFQKVKLFQAEIYQISYLNEKLIYVLNSPYFLFAKKKKNIEDAIIQSFQALYFPQQTDLVRKMGFNLIKEQLILLSGSISDTRKKSCFNVIMSLGNLKSNFTSKFSAPFFSGAQLQPLKYHNICKGKTSMFKTLSFIFLIRR